MDTIKGRPETGGRTSTDILSRIRETAASTPEQHIRKLTDENRRLAYELGIAQVDLARLHGEQEQLVEAYDALEKRHDDDVRRLTKELEKLTLASAALEEERGSLDLESLDTHRPGDLNVKDIANKPRRGDGCTFGEDGVDTDNSIPSVQTVAAHPSEQRFIAWQERFGD